MAKQKIQEIKLDDLHLWSENPRDPINVDSTDHEIIKRAIAGNPTKWNLQNLISEMGSYYDFSELPTVVNVDGRFVVYDGNRRIAVLKYLQSEDLYASLGGGLFFKLEPNELRVLTKIPCNICDVNTALTNIERKHSSNGSWGVLEREYFLNVHRGYAKSVFLRIDEQTRLITDNPLLNKRFVKDEVLTKRNLNQIGFDVDQEKGIVSNYSEQDAKEILGKVPALIKDKAVTTRDNRGELKKILLEKYPELEGRVVQFDAARKNMVLDIQGDLQEKRIRKTPVTKMSNELFGRALMLKPGKVNDLYRALVDIDTRTKEDDAVLPFIGMALRLLIEVAARMYYQGAVEDDQVASKFLKEAKNNLNQTDKNSLSLTNDWLSDRMNLNAILQKYAHGNIEYTREGILATSKIVADILDHYFKK
ncbi:hypothetical protein A2372_01790 [Candidatus Wolfebacteria bacterium RIFOXYB1_FULL_54_12]|uniref:ParB/Sulfiredoxin domain-containing protein n=1 Tax=Candidatus Wolfebacteria bacterium RIFOXYB1_FULL_54_12 TaxID=1802559 RepID=A0A1F8DX50_9BACT|nr:MAG: hypothetical protein A2372_01790 [Candidatus Wolfebacteria bacterium RIFOXYB1_FULL_54_12]